jgi:penicillin-binding protein 1B
MPVFFMLPMPNWRQVARLCAVLSGVAIGAIGIEALVRARLDGELARGPVRFYARPTVLQPGTPVARDQLEASLERLGYVVTRRREVGIGEFRPGRSDWVIGRRAFRLGEMADPGGVTIIRLDYDQRVESLEDGEGRRMRRVLLEPEVLHVATGKHREDRVPVALAEVPEHLVDAVLAVEDRRFFDHWGVDVKRVAGAFVANLRARRVVQGGSTLSQQLAKNLYLSSRRTPTRKARELAMALALEARHSKEEILEAYLNEIYLGQNGALAVHGVGRAAQFYFGKDVRRLEPRESALLAGMIRGPSLYSPLRNPARARERRDLVLAMMRDQGALSDADYRRARGAGLGVRRSAPRVRAGRYFADYLWADLDQRLGGALREPGLAVFTTLDMGLQVAAEDAVRDGLARLERDRPALRRGGTPLQAALVALDPHTGEIVAMVGGRDYGVSQFNRAVLARRQPGSAFKPVVALAALAERSHTLASVLEDTPLSVVTPVGRWEPVNYDQNFRGAVTLRGALERSLNVPFARLGLAIGPERIVETARRLGIESPLQPVPSLALGAAEVTPLEMARAFGVLAAEGYLADPQGVLAVVDAKGEVRRRVTLDGVRAFGAGETFLVTSALEGAVERGTGRGLRQFGYRGPVAAKSGTTNDYRDAWFVGYTPALVVAVWVGFDDGRSVGLPGARAALPIFARFLAVARGGDEARGFSVPRDVNVVDVVPESGLRAGWGCAGEPEYFLDGTVPQRDDDGCSSYWSGSRWLAEGRRLYREVRPRVEQELRPLVDDIRRRLERRSR